MLEGVERGGELLFVEGQGSLLHPAYSGVTLGLIHGSAPHAYVLCHRRADGRRRERALPDAAPRRARRPARAHEPARAAGGGAAIALNTRHLDEAAARAAVEAAEAETGLPADDPVRFGAAKLVDALLGPASRGGSKPTAAN